MQFNSPSYVQCFPQYSTPPLPVVPNHSGPFYVVFISGNISVCAGCHGRYMKPALPPYDICVKHQEWREFTIPSNPSVQRRFGNTYYHPSLACLRSRWPHIQSHDIIVEDDIKRNLSQEHKDFLATTLGIFV